MNKKRIKIGCLLFSIILLISLTGCTKSENSIVTSITNFSLESYQERIVSDRNSLKEVRNTILDNETKKKQCNNFDFSECDFSEFPDITDVSVFSNSYRGMTEQEALDLIGNWLKSIGKSEFENIKQQIFVISESYSLDETKEYPYCYRTISEQTPKFSAGDAVFCDTSDFYIMIDSNGIQSVSDGKIAKYLKREYAHVDVNHENYDIEETGTLEEMGSKEYSLIVGTLSVFEGADLVTKHFEFHSMSK